MVDQERVHKDSYEEVPYFTLCYPNSSPAHLEALGRIMGLDVAPAEKARVLELGCGSGGNLIPLAAAFPLMDCTGFDFTKKQIDYARDHAEKCSVQNVRFLEMDIADITPKLGKFDYIIAHGLYSWLPPHKQGEVLRIIRENLTDNGIAYVSYNVYPGWAMKDVYRYALRKRLASVSEGGQRIKQGIEVADFLRKAIPDKQSPYAAMMNAEFDHIQKMNPTHFLHDHLEEFNSPCYFLDFADRVKAAELRYLCDAELGSSSPHRLPPEVQAHLRDLSGGDVYKMEQYLDFLGNRSHRASLVVKRLQQPNRKLNALEMPDLFIAADCLVEENPDGPAQPLKATFRSRRISVGFNEPVGACLIRVLAECWPVAKKLSELETLCRAKLTELGLKAPFEREKLLQTIQRLQLDGFLLTRSTVAPQPSKFSDSLEALPHARFYANLSDIVPNCFHQPVKLNALNRQVLMGLGGKQGVKEIAGEMAQKLNLKVDGRLIQEEPEALKIVSESAQRLYSYGLLKA